MGSVAEKQAFAELMKEDQDNQVTPAEMHALATPIVDTIIQLQAECWKAHTFPYSMFEKNHERCRAFQRGIWDKIGTNLNNNSQNPI